MVAIVLVLIAFFIIWYYNTKEDEELNDAISKMDKRDDDGYNY